MISQEARPYLQSLQDPIFLGKSISVTMLRLDVVHAGISGNKWFKLKYNLKDAVSKGFDTILTFGGAFSNHIHATAIAASKTGLKSIGIIRGERVEPLNPTLRDAENMGMNLYFISRSAYRNKSDQDFIEELKMKFGEFYLIPEGGTNTNAIRGASEILNEIDCSYDFLISPVGTGGTISGLIAGSNEPGRILGIPVLKGDFLKGTIKSLVFDFCSKNKDNWQLITDYHFGGYAKFNPDLISFINTFKKSHNIPVDPIYTGKMMFGLYDLIKQGYFEAGTRIIALHTGGLQGIRGFNQRFGNLIK